MKVFISSVVRNYENYRATARRAVELLQHTPSMSEYFPAQPHSSQTACMTEVEESDVVVLILGAEYGFETPSGESVTQQEYRHARALNKPVLVFIENVQATGKQQAFRQEVSDYVDGLFRESFSTEAELYDAIIKSIHQLKQRRSSPGEQEFLDRLKNRGREGGFGGLQGAVMEFTFYPHPAPGGALRAHDKQRNALYVEMCNAGLCDLASGYTAYDTSDTVGLDAPARNPVLRWRKQDDGLEWIRLGIQPKGSANMLSLFFVSPIHVRSTALTAYELIAKGRAGWYQIALEGIGNCQFAEPPPAHVNSISTPSSNVSEVSKREFLMAANEKVFTAWLEEVLYAFERKISYR